MRVILAEKPDQARKLAAPFPQKKENGFLSISPCKEFSSGANVTWAIGHLVELKEPDDYNEAVKDVFSIGRVQTPVLVLIYNRQQEIEERVSPMTFR